MPPPSPSSPSRRRFLGYVLAAPTLVTAARWVDPPAADARAVPSIGPQLAESYDLLDFLRDAARPTANLITVEVGEDGTISFDLHRTEVGQGIATAVAMLIAEELGVGVDRVRIRQAPARPELLFNQLTGGSNSIYTIYDPVRVAAAVARERLLRAAAIQFGAAGSELGIVDGVVRAPDGSSLGIGELSRLAASTVTEVVDAEPSAGPGRIVGTPQGRIDARSLVTGEHRYTADLDVPDALPTMMARPPTILGRPVAVRNADAVRAMPGVTDVAVIESGVAVRARTFGQCIDAIRALDVEWADGPAAGLDDAEVAERLAAAELPLAVPSTSALGGLGGSLLPQTKDFTFTFATRPNSPLETNPAIADVRADRAEMWGPMKNPIVAQQDIALALGLPLDAVTCHVVQAGGSFGRDLFWDAPREAALISQAMGKPVKLLWTRVDDFRQGRAHPPCRSTVRVVHDRRRILSYSQRHTSVNTDFGHGLGELFTRLYDELPGNLGALSFSQTVFQLTQYVPYQVGAVEQQLHEILPGPGEVRTNVFRTGSMRNIYSPDVATARELVIDRVAEALGRDPLEFRIATARDARTRAVLTTVGDAGNWGRSMAPGTAQGVGFHSEYKGRAACLVELDARPATVDRTVPGVPYAYTGPRVTRAVFAVDVGLTVNPTGLEAQMIGGMMDGIANALSFSLHLDDGAYREASWGDGYYTRQWNVPFDVEVHILDSSTQPGGAGEFGVAASMAATACAYARATGVLPTSFPINHDQPEPATVPRGEVPQSPTDGLDRIRP